MNGATESPEKPKANRLRRGILLLCAIAAIAGLLWLTRNPPEPSYQGKSLSAWLSQVTETSNLAGYDPDADNPANTEFRNAFRSMGTNAIPPLLRLLRAKDSRLKKLAMDLLNNQSYVNVAIQSREDQKYIAGLGLCYMGELATNAVPALIGICQNPSSSYSAEIADGELKRLYPAKSVEFPYWVAAENRAEWYVEAGVLQWQLGALSNAVLAFSQAIQLKPTDVSALVHRADVRLNLEHFAAAMSDYDRALEISPTNQSSMRGRGLTKLWMHDFRGAEAEFTKAINFDAKDYTALHYRGLTRANMRDFDAALTDLNQAIEFSPSDGALYLDRARVQGALTEYELALADVSESIRFDNQNAEAYTLRSWIEGTLRKYPAAIATASQAIQLAPKNSESYAVRAASYIHIDQFGRASQDLETALRLNPTNASAFLARGVLRAKRGGEDDAALADFVQALKLAPEAPETVGMLAIFQYKLSQFEPALLNFRRALDLKPATGESDFYAYIWLIRARAGEEEAANTELKTYLNSLDDTKTNEWSAITARFLSGSLSETNFLNLATTVARRPSAVPGQVCESLYYAGMKRKLARDIPGALTLFKKSLDTKANNTAAYWNAGVELRALSPP